MEISGVPKGIVIKRESKRYEKGYWSTKINMCSALERDGVLAKHKVFSVKEIWDTLYNYT